MLMLGKEAVNENVNWRFATGIIKESNPVTDCKAGVLTIKP